MRPEGVDIQYNDFDTNQYVSFTKTFHINDHYSSFAELSNDYNPLHHDIEYASYTEFNQPIVPMHLTTLPLSAIAGMVFPGHRSLYVSTTIQALKPIYYNDEVVYSARIVSKSNSTQTLKIRTLIYKNTTVLLTADQTVKVRKDEVPASVLEKIAVNKVAIQHIKPKILITGASGEIGKCTALVLAKSGFDLVLHYQKNKQEITSVAEQCQRYGVDVTIQQANLTDLNDIEKLALVISNESITHLIHTASSHLDSSIDQLITTNYTALKRLSESVLPNMLRQQFGHIIFIGSSAIHSYPAGWDNYIAAKSAAVSLINGINKNYQAYGIKAITVSPGVVVTPFSQQVRSKELSALLPEQVANAVIEALECKQAISYYSCELTGNRPGVYGVALQSETKEIPTSKLISDSVAEASNVQTEVQHKLNGLIRSFFKVNDDYDLVGSSFENFHFWDSLKHIQFLLEIENKFNIKFDSHVLDKTVTYNELLNLIDNITVGSV